MKRSLGLCMVGLCCALLVMGCEDIFDSSDDSSGSGGGAQGQGADGPGGFVWKPRSESNGRLVVLLPSSYAGNVRGVSVRRGSEVVEQGNFTGNTNGNRPTFRFSQPGGAYGNDLTVVAALGSGGSASWIIPNGGQRVD